MYQKQYSLKMNWIYVTEIPKRLLGLTLFRVLASSVYLHKMLNILFSESYLSIFFTIFNMKTVTYCFYYIIDAGKKNYIFCNFCRIVP